MSHLGDLLSALIDGELSGAELDRANAHVAACGACRVEANSLRRLKHELRALAEVTDCGEITRRLLAMSGEAGQAGPADLTVPAPTGPPGRARGQRARRAIAAAAPHPHPHPARRPGRRRSGRRRVRYVLWSTVSLVVVGIGTAAFGMGGSTGATGPRITPQQLEVFDIQHAITSGDVPFNDPADVSARVPAVAATP